MVSMKKKAVFGLFLGVVALIIGLSIGLKNKVGTASTTATSQEMKSVTTGTDPAASPQASQASQPAAVLSATPTPTTTTTPTTLDATAKPVITVTVAPTGGQVMTPDSIYCADQTLKCGSSKLCCSGLYESCEYIAPAYDGVCMACDHVTGFCGVERKCCAENERCVISEPNSGRQRSLRANEDHRSRQLWTGNCVANSPAPTPLPHLDIEFTIVNETAESFDDADKLALLTGIATIADVPVENVEIISIEDGIPITARHSTRKLQETSAFIDVMVKITNTTKTMADFTDAALTESTGFTVQGVEAMPTPAPTTPAPTLHTCAHGEQAVSLNGLIALCQCDATNVVTIANIGGFCIYPIDVDACDYLEEIVPLNAFNPTRLAHVPQTRLLFATKNTLLFAQQTLRSANIMI